MVDSILIIPRSICVHLFCCEEQLPAIMPKIHPSTNNKYRKFLLTKASVDVEDQLEEEAAAERRWCSSCPPSLLTVWKRSSMSFQGTDGFTVFDQNGSLVFRVDNYSRNNLERVVGGGGGGGLVLMDGAGKALLTLKPQIFSMQFQWNGYRGEDGFGKNPRTKVFSMRRQTTFLHSRTEDAAVVFMGSGLQEHGMVPDFRIEGSFQRRNCRIRSASGALVAKTARKKVNSTVLLSDDVFSLEIQPGFDSELIMAFVIILDRICVKPFVPALCS